MRKQQNRPPSHTSSSVDDEINVHDYPYYPYIPVPSIGERQKKILDKYRMSPSPVRYEEQVIIPKKPLPSVYEGSPMSSLPTFNLVPMEGENCYRVDMTPQIRNPELEKRLEDLQNEIAQNNAVIEAQKGAIIANESALQDQANKIKDNNLSIQNNNQFINQQITAYNHNQNILNQLGYNIHSYNCEINKQQQLLESITAQVTDVQTQLDELQLQLEGTTNQLAYHGSMLSAFNTLIQNPVYFTQLLTAASAFNPTPENYDETNTI